MGTKNDPAPFDCYAAAEPDEPMFVLLARDPDAPGLVEAWAAMRVARAIEEHPVDSPEFTRHAVKANEAKDCAEAMRAWREARS